MSHTPRNTPCLRKIVVHLFEQVSRATSPVLRWDDFAESTASALLSLLSHSSAARYFAAKPSSASFRTKFQRGEIAIGIGDLWKFQAVDTQGDEPLRIFGESKRFQLPPDRVLTTLSEPLKPKDGHEDNLLVPSTRYAQERYRFTGWEVGLELIKRTPELKRCIPASYFGRP